MQSRYIERILAPHLISTAHKSMSYFSNASAPPAVAIPHDGSFTLPEAEVMSVEQVQANAPDRAQAIRKVEHMGMPRGLAE